MPTPLFSVLIANYNNGQYIDDAIDSVLKQTYTNWEIVIVDDASTDQSLQLLSKYKSDGRIKIFKTEKNMGCGYTKRRCAELATGEICGFVDPDDAIAENALDLMVKAHLEHPEVSMVYSRNFQCDEKMNIVSESHYQQQIDQPLTYLHLQTGRIGHFVSFKTGLYQQTSGINPEYKRAVDQDLYFKLEEVGKLYFIDLPLYYYRHHKGSISLFDKKNKALAWGLTARVDACRRRGVCVEEILPKFFEAEQTVHAFYQKSSDYRIGKAILTPYRFLRYKVLVRLFKSKN